MTAPAARVELGNTELKSSGALGGEASIERPAGGVQAMRVLGVLVVLSAAMFSTGCATYYWTRANTVDEQFH